MKCNKIKTKDAFMWKLYVYSPWLRKGISWPNKNDRGGKNFFRKISLSLRCHSWTWSWLIDICKTITTSSIHTLLSAPKCSFGVPFPLNISVFVVMPIFLLRRIVTNSKVDYDFLIFMCLDMSCRKYSIYIW